MRDNSFHVAASTAVDLVEQIRGTHGDLFAGPVDLRLVDRLIQLLRLRLSNSPWLSEFVQQLEDFLLQPRERLACIEVSSGGLTLLVGFMRPSKAADAFFEAAVFKTECLPQRVLSESPSIATPVSTLECTSGLKADELFGIFAEHFGYGIPDQQFWNAAKAYYLTDRFERRFLTVTKPAIDRVTSQDSLRTLKQWMPTQESASMREFAAWWLSLHEHFHGHGPLPFHHHMRVKGNRLAAGYEELRVDLLAVLKLIRSGDLYQRAIAEYVMAERIFSYVLIDLRKPERKKMTFDSVGSHILLLKLLEAVAMVYENGSIRIEDHWPMAVQQLSEELQELETQIVRESSDVEIRRARLLGYVRTVTHCTAPGFARTFRGDDQIPVLELFQTLNDRLV